MEEKVRNLEEKSFKTKEEVCKWVNQYQKLTDMASIVYDSLREEFVIFFYWK